MAALNPKPGFKPSVRWKMADGVTGLKRLDNSHWELLDLSAQANSTLPSPSLHALRV